MQSDYRPASLRQYMPGLSNRPITRVFQLRQSEQPAPFPSPISPGFQCNTFTDSFPSLIFTFPKYLRWFTGNVMAWATCVGLKPPYTSKLYGALPHTAIIFALHYTLLLSSQFVHVSHPTCYSHTIPSISRSCNKVLSTLTTSFSTHHTSFTYSFAGRKIKILRHIFSTLGPQQLKLKFPQLFHRGPTFGVHHLAQIFYLFGAWGPCPLLPILKAATTRTHAVGVLAAGAFGLDNDIFLGPPHLHNAVGRLFKINCILFWPRLIL